MDYNDEFPQSSLTWLNHAGVSPWPSRTALAVTGFGQENITTGPSNYTSWLKVERSLKHRIQRLVGAKSADEIALVGNTSQALSMVAYGIRWHKGDHIVLLAEEFPSNRIVWESLQQFGVKVSVVEAAGVEPEKAIINAITPRTRLITVSSVQYGTGTRIDLSQLGKVCQQENIYFCVDAIQEVGAFPLSVEDTGIDFLAADGHKWMMGPEGLGFLYCSARVMENLGLKQYGWHMVEDMGNYDTMDWQPAATARRFECGSPNLLGIHALEASLSLIEEVGITHVAEQLNLRTRRIRDFIQDAAGCEAMSPLDNSRLAGIYTFSCKNSARLYDKLKKNDIFTAQRMGGIRFSPHFYTPIDKIDKALQIVETEAKKQ